MKDILASAGRFVGLSASPVDTIKQTQNKIDRTVTKGTETINQAISQELSAVRTAVTHAQRRIGQLSETGALSQEDVKYVDDVQRGLRLALGSL